MRADLIDFIQKNPSLSNRQIAALFDCSKSYIKKLRDTVSPDQEQDMVAVADIAAARSVDPRILLEALENVGVAVHFGRDKKNWFSKWSLLTASPRMFKALFPGT